LVSIGRIVDPQSRTVPVIYEVDNSDKRLAIGQAVRVRLFTSSSETAPAVRETAVVDDAGRPVVFVQLAGEAFARRPVKLGNRQNEYVQIVEGVRPGERVVTKGAYLIRLAAMSSSIPAHGHVH
jgi:multidrug efflux pump subunit AcrA (membrane-fusion protein)